MTRHIQPADSQYDSLVCPLKSAGKFIESDHEELAKEESEVLNGTTFRRLGLTPPRRGTQIIRAGELTILAGKTTPILSSNSHGSENFSCFMAMPSIGGFVSRVGGLCDEVSPGDIYLNQNYHGTSTMGYLSSLFFSLDRKRLDRTIRTVSRGDSIRSLGTSVIIKDSRRSNSIIGTSKLWSLITLIDQLYGEHASIPSCLGLDDQFYRLLALSLLESVGRLDTIQQRWQTSPSTWANRLDELVDYIRENAHLNLTLTDLEEQSHYSARHLQNLFRERFNCTPMQFVRRQRLSAAMEKLQAGDWSDTVTTIARAIGYRHVSSFSQDFKNEFGVNPSVVLRASRGEGRDRL